MVKCFGQQSVFSVSPKFLDCERSLNLACPKLKPSEVVFLSLLASATSVRLCLKIRLPHRFDTSGYLFDANPERPPCIHRDALIISYGNFVVSHQQLSICIDQILSENYSLKLWGAIQSPCSPIQVLIVSRTGLTRISRCSMLRLESVIAYHQRNRWSLPHKVLVILAVYHTIHFIMWVRWPSPAKPHI